MTTICIVNLPDHYTEIIVKDLCARYGKIISLSKLGLPWYVSYSNVRDAQRAMIALNGAMIEGDVISVVFEDLPQLDTVQN